MISQKHILFCFFFLITAPFWAQETTVFNQIKAKIDTTKNVANKVQLYADLAWEYIMVENDSALFYADQALVFSRNNDYALGQAISLETKGLYHEIASGNYDLASTFYFDGIAICEANQLDYAYSIYHSLGVMFHTSDSYQKAIEYYNTAYEGAQKTKDVALQKKCLINLGAVNNTLENYDQAIDYMQQSLELDVRRELDYTTYVNLGYLYTNKEEFDKAMPYLEKATEIHPDNYDSEVNLYMLLNAKTLAKDTVGMQPYLERAKKAINSVVGIRSKSLLLRNLADYYKFTGDYKQALEFRDEYITVFEEIKEKQRDQTVYDLETKYQTQQTELELAKKEASQRLLFWILGFIALLLALLAFFFIKNRKKNAILTKQKTLLEATIDEKNTLLKETHHRVKNSFQIVSSLLYLQSENIEDSQAKTAMKEAQNRVRSMVLIHQKLYNKDQLVGVSTKEYFTDLVIDIFESHVFKQDPMRYQIEVQDHVLAIETITPLGLILNELVTNVIKHAFPKITSESLLQVYLKEDNEQLILEVIDNGQGMPKTIDESSFGIQLITALSKKLKAQLDFKTANPSGTHAVLKVNRYQKL